MALALSLICTRGYAHPGIKTAAKAFDGLGIITLVAIGILAIVATATSCPALAAFKTVGYWGGAMLGGALVILAVDILMHRRYAQQEFYELIE